VCHPFRTSPNHMSKRTLLQNSQRLRVDPIQRIVVETGIETDVVHIRDGRLQLQFWIVNRLGSLACITIAF
jgi:hypothetical protein